MGPEDRESEREFLDLWGTEAYARAFAQEEADLGNALPPEVVEHMAMASRGACTPDVARRMADIWYEIDVREILGSVATPTLLLVHEDRESSVEKAEYVASRMPAAEIRRMPGSSWTLDEAPAWAEQIRDFIGLERPAATLNTVLSTVLFTDIVDSTARQASLGDRGWKELVLAHHAVVRDALTRWRGVENDTAGDGFYATFDGPARAIHCAQEISERVRDLGIEIRAGVHTGECEVIENKCSGLTVSIGARVAAQAAPSTVMVSQTVKDLVAGSGLTFEDAGEHELKGVPDRWRLYRVVS